MNELEIKQLIEKNKELLKERTEIQIEQYETRFELKEIEEQLINIANENEKLEEKKEELTKQLITNILQFLAISAVGIIGCNLIVGYVAKGFINFLIVINVLLDALVVVATIDELKDYKKITGMEYFDKEISNNIEESKEIKIRELTKLEKKLNINTRKLDKIYNMSVNEIIVSPSNNEYSNEEESVKTKQKKIEKK